MVIDLLHLAVAAAAASAATAAAAAAAVGFLRVLLHDWHCSNRIFG